MSKVYVFFAPGCEEVEGLTVVDLLRRAGVDTSIVSMGEELTIVSSHKVAITADLMFDDIKEDADMLVLPGGLPGTDNLAAHKGLAKMIEEYNQKGKYLAAVCAAPSVYGMMNLLENRCATCYPSFEDKLLGANFLAENVVVDGNFITSRGLGTCIDFGLKLVELLMDRDKADQLAKKIIYR